MPRTGSQRHHEVELSCHNAFSQDRCWGPDHGCVRTPNGAFPQVRASYLTETDGGQGRGRTVDLPIFSRTLVPTELPGRAPEGAREEYPTTRHTQKMGYAVWPAPWTRSLARDASLVLGDLSPQLFDEIDQLRHDVVGDSTDGRLVLDAATGADQLRHRDR